MWPAQRPTGLELALSLEEIGRSSAYRLIRIRIVGVNPTDRRLYLLTEWYTVWGHQIARQDPARFRREVDAAPLLTVTARHAIVRTEVVATGRIVAGDALDGFHWYDPHVKVAHEAVFAVPAQLYDFLTVRVQYYYARDTTGAGPARWELREDASWFPRLTVRSQGGDSLEDFDTDHNARHREWERANAPAQSSSSATLSLWPGSRSP